MKKRATTYTFDASAQTIDCALFTSLEAIQLITNVTDNIIIYNFADPTKGGSLTSTTLTLTYDTSSMADTDKLQILVEDGSSTESVSGTVTANAGTNLNTSALALETGGNLASIKTNTDKIPVLGQALASASVPVILPSATITTLTPPAAITNFANETGGNLAAIKAKTDNIPALGQALAASSVPVVLTADQVSTLTPPAAITGFATSAKQLADNHQVTVSNIASTPVITGFATEAGHLATIDTSTAAVNTVVGAKTDAKSTATDGTSVSVMQVLKQISASVQAPPSQAVTNATAADFKAEVVGTGTFATQATLAAETTKVIGTVNVAASQTIAVTQATAANLKVDLSGTAANSTAVKVNVASGGIASGGIASGAIAAGATAIAANEDDASAAGDRLVKMAQIRLDTPVAGANVSASGDYTQLIADSFGKTWTADNQIEDTAHTSGDRGSFALAVRTDTPAASSGTTGDYEALHTDATGSLWVDPQGNVAHDSADSGNPVKIGGKALSADITAVATGDRTDSIYDLLGKQVVTPYALPQQLVSGATSDITNTTATNIIAGVASNYLYITSLLVTNSHATVGTFVNITEETSGTVLYTGYAAPAGGGFSLSFPTPLKVPTAAKALQATCVTTGANVRASATGYKATI